MATTPEHEEPGFDHQPNELSEDQSSTSEHEIDDQPDESRNALEEAQKDAAQEREENGGYQ